jgi:hypothetical protein
VTFAAFQTLTADDLNDMLSYVEVETRVTSNQALATSSTTLQNVTQLALAVAAARIYTFDILVAATLASGTTEDIKIGFSYPAGGQLDFFSHGADTSLTNTAATVMEVVAQLNAVSGTTAAAFGVSGSNTSIRIWGRLDNTSGVAGNLQVMAAQNTSGANVVSVKAGSLLRMVRKAT